MVVKDIPASDRGFARRALVSLSVILLAACTMQGGDDEARRPGGAIAPLAYTLDTVATGLEVPWDLAFAPDGRIFLTERVGRIRVVEKGTLQPTPWAALEVAVTGEAGLMGIALAPDFPRTGHVYVVATVRRNGTLVNQVIRLADGGDRGRDPIVIVDGIPAANFHAGDAIAFGPDDLMYVATGDARDPGLAQDPRSLGGKILRYRADGTVPDDNPVPGSPVYASGIRNSQGLAWHPESGDLFAIDHGPSGFPDERFRRDRDELNVVPRGANLGWPDEAGMSSDQDYLPPIAEWTPAIAPAGLAIYSGSAEAWRGSAFVGGLRGKQLRRIVLEPAPTAPTGWRVAAEQPLFENQLGRIRAVVMGPDNAIYFTTSNRDGRGDPAPGDDKLLRLRPAE